MNKEAIAVLAGAVVLAACSSKPKTVPVETTAAKVERSRAEALDRLDKSARVLSQMGGEVSSEDASRAKCVVVFPSVVMGGVIVSGRGGRGYAACQTVGGWSAPAPISIDVETMQNQIGAQATEVLALVDTDKGKNALMSGDFKVGVDASCAMGDLVSYSHAKGPYAGAKLDGTTIKADQESARAIFGANYDMKSLLGGGVHFSGIPSAQRFLSAADTVLVRETSTARD